MESSTSTAKEGCRSSLEPDEQADKKGVNEINNDVINLTDEQAERLMDVIFKDDEKVTEA